MPFMKGKAPIRRTLRYLLAGSLVLKDRVKVFCVNYNHHGDHHKGARYVFPV
jgi:small subunit ribosomal protein S25